MKEILWFFNKNIFSIYPLITFCREQHLQFVVELKANGYVTAMLCQAAAGTRFQVSTNVEAIQRLQHLLCQGMQMRRTFY